jgi:hypothetical protein
VKVTTIMQWKRRVVWPALLSVVPAAVSPSYDQVPAASALAQRLGPIEKHLTVASWRKEPAELALQDSLSEQRPGWDGAMFPPGRALRGPLIGRRTRDSMRIYEHQGAVDNEFYGAQAGVYAVDAYQPGRVPVVLVHGLWSSPKVWLPMIDALRADPALRASYQFWVALYPSGYPLPLAALSLRRSLRKVRLRFDPSGADRALDQMVILGKSTGGQVTRMLVEPSGETIWNAFFTRPIDQINAAPALRAELAASFFFQPEPYVRRVIFLATGHRGSQRERRPGIRLGAALVRRSNPLQQTWAELEAANGRTIFQPPFRDRVPSSVDGIEARSPLLMALDRLRIAPEVVCHSIIANIRRHAPLEKISDGLVGYPSAHLEGAASECIVTASHFCEADPEVIAEVRRILTAYLMEAKGKPGF